MAESFWKALGSKLVETGAAYLQQVSLVNELKQLSPEDARARFAKYVAGLSTAARSGFAVTLAAMANSETSAEAKRFIESLRAALANPTAPIAAHAPEAVAPPLATPHLASFDDDLQRTTDWYGLHGDQREQAVIGYVTSLNLGGLESLHANLAQMKENAASHIDAHRENEARIAGGRFVEDQMSYRMAVLRTGQHDPDWLRQLHEFEGWARWYDALHNVVSQQIDECRRPPEPAAVPPPAPAESAPLGHGEDADTLDALKHVLAQQLASGAVRGERAVALRRTLEKIETLLAAKDRGEISAEEAVLRCQQLARDIAPMFADPGSAKRAAHGSPLLREVDSYAGGIKAAVTLELMPPPPAATAEALAAVLGDLREFQERVAEVKDDEELAQLEHTLLRPAAKARHELALTRHAMIARPLWECGEYVPAVNAIAYSGGADLQQQVEAALAPRLLTVVSSRRLQHQGQVRWDDLNSCHVAMFDLRGASQIESLATKAPKRARELAAAAYELGLAFALGKPVVVISESGESMPFDVDLSPLTLDGGEDDDAMIRQAVDEAFYVPQRTGRDSSIGKSVAFLDAVTVDHKKRKVFEGMGWLDPALAMDPAGFAANASQLLSALSASRWRLLRPAWPSAYPDVKKKRCFHVMPFGPPWANETRDVARRFCREHGLVYRRGDEAEEGRIIHAIWGDLCRANVVLVDLTGANLNVMIELGMAHAIGRPILAVRRADGADVRPRNIEKLRVLTYDSPAQLAQLLETKLTV